MKPSITTVTQYLLLLTAATFTAIDAFTPTITSKAFIACSTKNDNRASSFQQVQDDVGPPSSHSQLNMASDVVSPFDDAPAYEEYDDEVPVSSSATGYNPSDPTDMMDGEEMLELTWENVDDVLEEMRPYLIQDGGNVKISEIDGPIVRLELEGACGTCPSSTQTMKMGLERRLRERIPEIQEVIQAMPEGPDLNEDQVEVILEGVRPFLQVAGGSIRCESITGVGGVQPQIMLKMEGSSASLQSVKLEIAQRLQRHFMMAGLRVEW
eukprot:CAMPEP_0198262794 /NCGR_PEP_ID=MMETSP1447-20131203/11250_1 /TAXON_ID=420782 /ORGANISM="Chaetoceros dichaeta, Strain CCMP1751" /LENGTH=266 /DNA_ID=CAMNT_0043951159 /DNA_START=45 /DNA_END=842 /DNA_ORIENTATION=+